MKVFSRVRLVRGSNVAVAGGRPVGTGAALCLRLISDPVSR